MNSIFETGELFDTDRAARVQLAGGDADLGPKAEFATVCELRGSIVQHKIGRAHV